MTNPQPYLEKVTAFITRVGPAGAELLLFRHPTAGVQIPAGTVEAGETPEQAALREAFEETGLRGLTVVAPLGQRDELPPGCTHIVSQDTPVYSHPHPTSFNWARLPRGVGVRLLRESYDYAQITYEEGDRFPDPQFTSYVITGWVSWEALALNNRRYFFHLICAERTPERWSRFADQHTFEPFWAAIDRLPAIVAPQQAWWDYVTVTLGYQFSDPR